MIRMVMVILIKYFPLTLLKQNY